MIRKSIDAEAKLEEVNTMHNKEIENPPKRRSARLSLNTQSMAEKSEKKILPYILYKGDIKYLIEGMEIAEAADSVMQWVDKQAQDVVPLSFDMEWPFSFQTGAGKSSVIQICVELNCCYVFQLTKLKKLPAALMALLKHPKVRLHGDLFLATDDSDFRKLARDFPEVNADILIAKCVDLGLWCNEVCETGGRWSLERLSNYIAELGLDKNKKIRMSKWQCIPLDENQLLYAATDVYIGLIIYNELEKRERAKQINEVEFKEKNGELAFKAVKALGETFLDKICEMTI